jgi:hypothetical protein
MTAVVDPQGTTGLTFFLSEPDVIATDVQVAPPSGVVHFSISWIPLI